MAIRHFFTRRGYLEVDTPLLLPNLIPEEHIDPVRASRGYLQTSPEMCMKRLLAAGYERVFQICKCFRDTERGTLHLPEFTMLEWYRARIDYRGLMEECEELLPWVTRRLGIGNPIPCRGHQVDLTPPWERLSVQEAFRRLSPLSVEEALEREVFDEILTRHIEPHLGSPRPTFLYDYPVALGALARRKAAAPELAERFELYLAGIELANGFSELNDVREQRERFQAAVRFRSAQGKETAPIPERFLQALPCLPESAGIALGVDRLTMVLTDAGSIDQVSSFTPEEL